MGAVLCSHYKFIVLWVENVRTHPYGVKCEISCAEAITQQTDIQKDTTRHIRVSSQSIVIVCQWVVAISPAAVRLSIFLVLVATTAAAVQQRGCVKGLMLLKDIATIWTEEG